MNPALPPLVGVVAFLYAMVGHGGASGYLAVMSVAGSSPVEMASGALLLNLLVAGLSFAAFRRAGHRPAALVAPFLLGSIPASLAGGWFAAPGRLYNILLAVVLLAAAIRMAVLPAVAGETGHDEGVPPPPWTRTVIGAAIGLVSGIVGVGGGIFLSPLLIWRRWSGVRTAAAAAAVFIFVNSLAGLAGRALAGRFAPDLAWPVVAAAAVGGWLGGRAGAERVGVPSLRRILAGVLLIAAVAKVAR